MLTRNVSGRYRMTDRRRYVDAAQKTLVCTYPHPGCIAERKGENLEIVATGTGIPIKGTVAIYFGHHYVAEIRDNQLDIFCIAADDGVPGAQTMGKIGEDGGDDRAGRMGDRSDQSMAAMRELNRQNDIRFGRVRQEARVHPDAYGPAATAADINRAHKAFWNRA